MMQRGVQAVTAIRCLQTLQDAVAVFADQSAVVDHGANQVPALLLGSVTLHELSEVAISTSSLSVTVPLASCHPSDNKQ